MKRRLHDSHQPSRQGARTNIASDNQTVQKTAIKRVMDWGRKLFLKTRMNRIRIKSCFYATIEALLLLALAILWCEVGYYYYTFQFNCPGWPEPPEAGQDFTRIYVLADVHIMGPIKSARIDKLRREWQMEQAYRISNQIYKPDIVLFLGDILDEGSFSSDEAFKKATQDFERIFPIIEDRPRIVIVGNHDAGFHDRMLQFPFLMHRFQATYNATPSIELFKFKGLNFIASNSMSFYNDTCPYCSHSIFYTNQIAKQLDSELSTSPNTYTAPILLTHIPLYRLNDEHCDYPNSLSEKVKKMNIEGEDVIHKQASQFILDRLSPRLILSGHTHMICQTNHTTSNNLEKVYRELTISSFNHKNAEKEPGFLLLSTNSTHVYTRNCGLIDERIILLVYIVVLLLICFRLAHRFKFKFKRFNVK